jgi:hypothetical protein
MVGGERHLRRLVHERQIHLICAVVAPGREIDDRPGSLQSMGQIGG